MKMTQVLLLVWLFAMPGKCMMAQEQAAEIAKKADLAWLTLVDFAKYKESWDAAATGFKAKVTEAAWEQGIRSVRAPLGTLTARSFQDATSSNTLPGMPDGTYVVAHFQSSFEHKQAAVETVVASLEKDGSWRVTGYFIK